MRIRPDGESGATDAGALSNESVHSAASSRPKIFPDLLQESQNQVLKLATDLELVMKELDETKIERERLKAENQQIKAKLEQTMVKLEKCQIHMSTPKTEDPVNSVKEQTLLSFSQPCTQSTAYDAAHPGSNAVDGTLQKYSFTSNSSKPTWWRVELPDGSTVDEVILVRRLDDTPSTQQIILDRSRDFWVILRDENLNEVAKIHHPGKMATTTFKKFRFFGVVAKYVEVRMGRAEYMHWQQVLVYGQTSSNIMSCTCPTSVMDFAS